MNISANLRLNLTGAEADAPARARRYQAAVDMAAYADQQGFSSVNVEEHHVADNGWLPSPLTMAAAIAARTDHCGIGIMALLVPLYDPIRLAEDIAVVDLLSNGRLNFVAGLGYREIEFHIANKPYAERGKWMDHVLDTLLKAWGDEPFEYKGKMVNVTPKPFSRPHPFFLVGGMSKPAARRAARLGLPFAPPVADPALETYYHQQCELHGTTGFTHSPPADFSVLFIHENPDEAWETLGQHFLNEVMEYSSWKTEGVNRPLEFSSQSVAALREEKRYEIITPQECMRRHRDREDFFAAIHPLIGGMPLEDAWKSLRLYAEQVVAPWLADKDREHIMQMTAELTLYPFNEDYLPPIKGFIEFLNTIEGLSVETHATCTIISGGDQLIFDTLRDGLRWCTRQHGKVVLISKMLPGMGVE